MQKNLTLSPQTTGHLLGVWLVLFCLLVVPRPWALSPFQESKTYLLLLLPMLLLLCARKIPWDWVSFTLLGMLGVAGLSILLSGQEIEVMVYGINGRSEGLLYVAGLHLSLLMLYATFKTNPPDLSSVWPYFVFTVLTEAVIVLMQVHGSDPISPWALPGEGVPAGIGTFGSYGITSSLLALSVVPLVVRALKSPPMWLLVVLLAFTLMTLGNRTSLVLMAVPLLTVFWSTRKPQVLVFAVLALPIMFFGNPYYSQYVKPFFASERAMKLILAREGLNTNTLQTRGLMWQIARENLLRGGFSPWLGGGDNRYLELQKQTDPQVLFRLNQMESGMVVRNVRKARVGTFHTLTYDRQYCDEGGCSWEFEMQLPINSRAHNAYFDFYFQYGVFYLLGFLALMLGGVLHSWKHFSTHHASLGVLVGALLYVVLWFLGIGNTIFVLGVAVLCFTLPRKDSTPTGPALP